MRLSLSQTTLTSVLWSMTRLTRKRRHLLKAFLLLLCLVEYYNRIRKREHLLREAVVLPRKSPWRQLMDFGDPSSFLLMTGLTREAFGTLHDILQPPGYHRFQRTKGCSWSLPSDAQLGLLLFYLGSTMNYKHLCLIFGITPSACSRILNNMIKLVVRRLHSMTVQKSHFRPQKRCNNLP